MVKVKNDILNAYVKEEYRDVVDKFFSIGKNRPWLFLPFKGIKDEIAEEFLKFSLKLFSTSKRTLVLEDLDSEVVVKITFPHNLKHKILNFLINRELKIYRVSEYLRQKGIKIAEVLGYGKILRNPFYIIPKMKGSSFLEVLREDEKDIFHLFYKIVDEVIKIHQERYFLGDSNIKHFFFIGEEIEGIVDFDCIKKVYWFKKNRFCRDLGYLLRPELKIEEKLIDEIISYYAKKMKFNSLKILKKVKVYREKRWT
ncbi:MAG: hypothetical protein NZ845_04380 [Thermodesulfovibrio sp.]|nr:hypothetical protein [Thermodesulfovibrio sp.]